MGEERLALRGFPLFFLIIPFEAHLLGCSKHRGVFVGLWCRCRVVVPAPAVLPLRGALPFREPTPPKPGTTTRRGLDFIGSSLFSAFLSFHSSSLASLFFSSIRLLLPLSSFVSFPSCFILSSSSSSFVSFSLCFFHPSSYLTSFALHRFTSPCNIIICHPLSAVTLFSVGAARVPAPEKNQTLPAIHETQALPSFTKALCAPW